MSWLSNDSLILVKRVWGCVSSAPDLGQEWDTSLVKLREHSLGSSFCVYPAYPRTCCRLLAFSHGLISLLSCKKGTQWLRTIIPCGLMGKENSSSRLMRAWSVSENGIIWVFQLCKSLVGKERWTRKGSLGLYSLPAPCPAGRDKPLAMPFLGEQLVSGLHCLEKFQHTLILWR